LAISFTTATGAASTSSTGIARLVQNLRGNFIGDEDTVIRSPGNVQRPRLQPQAEDLVDRIWYGAGSTSSVKWAGEQGLNLLSAT
jgi:alkanesulfonate monooxygenase SsuD/methylene tetrahydromethanopterin reductase-like flavin-dependent oxidoreductase (luciferase family)